MRMRVNSRILLVEDDPTIVKTLTEFLKLEGFLSPILPVRPMPLLF